MSVIGKSPFYPHRDKEALTCRLQQWGKRFLGKAAWSGWLHSAPGMVPLFYHDVEKVINGITLRGFSRDKINCAREIIAGLVARFPVEHLVPKEGNCQVAPFKMSSLLGILLVEPKVVSPFTYGSLPEEETLGIPRPAPLLVRKCPDYKVSLLATLPDSY